MLLRRSTWMSKGAGVPRAVCADVLLLAFDLSVTAPPNRVVGARRPRTEARLFCCAGCSNTRLDTPVMALGNCCGYGCVTGCDTIAGTAGGGWDACCCAAAALAAFFLVVLLSTVVIPAVPVCTAGFETLFVLTARFSLCAWAFFLAATPAAGLGAGAGAAGLWHAITVRERVKQSKQQRPFAKRNAGAAVVVLVALARRGVSACATVKSPPVTRTRTDTLQTENAPACCGCWLLLFFRRRLRSARFERRFLAKRQARARANQADTRSYSDKDDDESRCGVAFDLFFFWEAEVAETVQATR